MVYVCCDCFLNLQEFKNQGDDLFGECKLSCNTGVVKLSGHVAMRRYVEKNRLTFVWECVGTCQNDPYSTKVVQMHEKGWYVLLVGI